MVSFTPQDEIAQQLLNSDWSPIEEHFGHEAPQPLKKHHADPRQVLMHHFEVSSPWVKLPQGIHVGCFTPINAGSVDGFFEELEDYVEIASGVFGGRFVANLSKPNPTVYLHHYDIGRDPDWFRTTGLSLTQFLHGLRVPSIH